MKKNLKKYVAYSILPVAAFALLLSNNASASGWGWAKNADPAEVAEHQQAMFENQASLLGTNIDTVKNAWAQGKTMSALADELGVSESDLQTKIRAAHQAEMKSHLQTLVEKGVITQAQADQRSTYIGQRMADSPTGAGRGMGRHGMRGGGLGGFGWQ